MKNTLNLYASGNFTSHENVCHFLDYEQVNSNNWFHVFLENICTIRSLHHAIRASA